ncbi:flavodoxin [Denitrovibrio acetiphilus DSM 12809]|uniref:Flavodoxin n=1 Tax=Denitrovibrio acetiphilus (strain DSM 12809 / NBRC 114555 / N2460) TaxID=522772 RepID=D4H7Q9_DENA2|nr:flavodoxin [Denitrovibrio acetiphilus]ADD68058.1 flavodoxin [Denitrovibrio acetiphilus DSM 12809]
MGKIGLFYGSNGGVTQSVADSIASALKKKGFEVDVKDIASSSNDDIAGYENVIFGTSTWGMGDLQDDWDSFVANLGDIDFGGKKVAYFGTGDQFSYPETFVDGIGLIDENVSGAEVIGQWPSDDYDFSDSKAYVNGSFIGLALDEDNQSNLTDDRISKWVDILAGSFS